MGCYWEDGTYQEQTVEDRETLERGARIAACVNACDGWTTKELQNRCFLKTGTISESGRPVAHLADCVNEYDLFRGLQFPKGN